MIGDSDDQPNTRARSSILPWVPCVQSAQVKVMDAAPSKAHMPVFILPSKTCLSN